MFHTYGNAYFRKFSCVGLNNVCISTDKLLCGIRVWHFISLSTCMSQSYVFAERLCLTNYQFISLS